MDEGPVRHQVHRDTQEQTGTAMGTANEMLEQGKTAANQAMEQAKTMARNIGDQARAAAADPGATAQELARRARDQASVAGDVLYRQGQRAGEYLTQNVNEYPLTALLIAGMVGYGLAYLIHTQWQGQISWRVQD
jgi:ElaB/YqjD/DUF883 family membrane-anchored ribosome-binding protein